MKKFNKRIILLFFAITVISLFTALNIAVNRNDKSLALFSLENADALAADERNPLCPNGCYENGYGCYCYGWHQFELEGGYGF